MKSLSELTEEILSLIFAGDSSFLVIDIWKCGDVVMNYKLTRCIYTITLKDRRLYSTSRWPKCLTAFTRLRSLSVSKEGMLMPASMTLMAEILKLPPTLKSLKVDSSTDLWEIPRSCKAEKRAAERINYASYLALRSSLNGKTPLPLLNRTRLKLNSLRPPLSPLLSILLSNITILSAHFPLEMTPPFPRLETVKGSVIVNYPIELLPSLKHIEHVQVDESDHLMWVYRRMTFDSLYLRRDLTAELTRLLPVTLTTLWLRYVDVDSITPSHPIWTEILPRTLRSIRFISRIALNDLLISKLPRSITSLSDHMLYDPQDAMNGIVMDLPNLKEWHNTPKTHPLMINKLPPSVTNFSMKFTKENTSNFSFKLPEQLKMFNPHDYTIPLPTSSLSTLKHLESYCGPMESQHLQCLPSSIKRIELYNHCWTNPETETLCAVFSTHLTSLESLRLEGWHAAHLDSLPKTITNLKLYSLNGMDSESISSQLAHLPPRLQSLTIDTPSKLNMNQPLELSHIAHVMINDIDPRLAVGKISNRSNGACYPDLRISKLPYPESFFKSDSIHDAVPTDALNHPIWSHLDNQNQNPNLNLKSILPSHWLPSIVDVANAIDCCMIEVDDTTRHSMMQLATQPRLTEWTQSRLLELCLMPYWTVRKLGIAICILDHENYVQPTK